MCAAVGRALAGDDDPRVRQAIATLASWDFQLEPGGVAGTLFNVFFVHWCRAITAERLAGAAVELAAANAWRPGNSPADRRRHRLVRADRACAPRFGRRSLAALAELTARLSPDPINWTWGRLHTLVQKHFLSGRGDLGVLLDRSGVPVRGDVTTVSSSTPDTNYAAALGAGYRMVADLADPRLNLRAVEVGGASGHPGSPHYDDQIATWSAGGYHDLPLRDTIATANHCVLLLEPAN